MPEKPKMVEVVEVTAPKAGYKTTEFWLSCIAQIFGMLMASGIVEAGSTWDKAVGLGVMALTSMGYSAARATAKKSVTNA